MAEPSAEEVEVEMVEARPLRTTIRYSTESSRTKNRHVTVNFDAVEPGDIGGLYAAISTAITNDLNRLRRGSRPSSSKGSSSKGSSSKASSFFGSAAPGVSSGTPPTPLNPLDCELKVELCRLLDKDGMLFLPPVKDTSVFRQKHAQLQSSNSQDPRDKKYDFLAFLLDRDVKNGWDHLQDGLFFEEGEDWPWYCLLVSFSHEARLDKIVKYQGRLVMADVDPQCFFPQGSVPPPSPPSPISRESRSNRTSRVIETTETVTVSSKSSKRYPRSASEPPKKPTRTPSSRSASSKYAEVRAKSKSAFTIGSLVKAQR